jgi:hypothetical protein
MPYFHPWMSRRAEGYYALYREPQADPRTELPVEEAVRIIDAIWRRAYRVHDPERRDTWRYMLQKLQGRTTVGADPGFLEPLSS